MALTAQSQNGLDGLLTYQVGTGCARWTTGAFHHARVAAPRRSVSRRGLGQSEFWITNSWNTDSSQQEHTYKTWYIHNPDMRKDPEFRSRGKEHGHESSRGWQPQVSEIKVSERNLLIGPFLHSTPNSITISFRHLTCHGGGGPLEYQEACPFKYPGW